MSVKQAHVHGSPPSGVRLLITLVLNLVITVAELIGGLISGSLALLSDALHNLSDAVAVVISYLAIRLERRPNSESYTFGLKRAQILAAIINAAVLIGISLYLIVEAAQRFRDPPDVAAGIMTWIASIGLMANVTGTLLLRRGAKGSMNIRAAYLHLFSDAVSSLAVILGGVAILLWQATWVDPVLTVFISIYILVESLKIVWEATHIVMMGAPVGVSIPRIEEDLLAIPGIRNLHHLHLWQMNERDIHLEAHVDVDDMRVAETSRILDQITSRLADGYDVGHVTIQFECDHCGPEALIADQGKD